MSDYLVRLQGYRSEAVETLTRPYLSKPNVTLVCGYLGATSFCVTEDFEDGQIEASVSRSGELATLGHVRALCKKMGAPMPDEVSRIRTGGLIWIVRQGINPPPSPEQASTPHE